MVIVRVCRPVGQLMERAVAQWKCDISCFSVLPLVLSVFDSDQVI